MRPRPYLSGLFYIEEKLIKVKLKIKMKSGEKIVSTNWLKNHRQEKRIQLEF